MLPRRWAGRTVLRHHVAVFRAQLHADVSVQLHVERADLFPQAIELLGEVVGRHVVLLPPHRAGVGEAEFFRALVRQLHEARVVLAHRRRDGVPALPDLPQLGFAARFGHHLGDVVDVHAGLRLRRIGAPLAASVGAAQARGNLGQFGRLAGIGRRHHDERQLQQIELTPRLGRNLHAVVGSRFLGVPGNRLDDLLLRARVERLGVLGDVGLRDPARLRSLDAELQHRVIDVGQKLPGIVCRLRRRGRLGAPARCRQNAHRQDQTARCKPYETSHHALLRKTRPYFQHSTGSTEHPAESSQHSAGSTEHVQ
jgi:hypothetical protein